MNCQINIDKLTPELHLELETHFKLIITRINEIINFCNLTNKNNILPEITELWADKSIVPQTRRLSSPNFSIKFGDRIIERSLINNDEDSIFTKLTNQLDQRIQLYTAEFYKQHEVKQQEFELTDFASNQKAESAPLPIKHSIAQHLQFIESCERFKLVLEVAKIHTQCMIAQTASLKSLINITQKISQLNFNMDNETYNRLMNWLGQMEQIIKQHQLLHIDSQFIKGFSRNDVLSSRQKFSQICSQFQNGINQLNIPNQDKQKIHALLDISRKCYYVKNDVNFTFPLQGSHSWSSVKHSYYRNASSVSLAATITALVSFGIAFFVPPIGFVAVAAGTVALVSGAPVALAKLTETMNNFVKYQVDPSTEECLNIGFLATSLLSIGLDQVINNALTAAFSYTNNSAKLITSGLSYLPAKKLEELQDTILTHGQLQKPNSNDTSDSKNKVYKPDRTDQEDDALATLFQSG